MKAPLYFVIVLLLALLGFLFLLEMDWIPQWFYCRILGGDCFE